jgi:hypothetical protein
MSEAVGWVFLAVASLIAAVNLYLGFARYFVARILRREFRYVSGIPLLGTITALVAITLLWHHQVAWLAFAVLLLLDTGSLFWLLFSQIVGPPVFKKG